MKCNKCGKEQSDKAVVCPYCGFRFIKEIPKETALERSTLIEFPSTSPRNDKSLRNGGSNTNNVVAASNDWRAELSAKVRQVKERRNMQEARGRLQAELEAAAHRYQQANQNPLASTAVMSSSASLSMIGVTSNPDLDAERPTNPVIEAALKRAQRASELAVKKHSPVAKVTSVASKLNSQAATQSLITQPSKSSSVAILAPETASSSVTSTNISIKMDIEDEEDFLSNIESLSDLDNLDNISLAIPKADKEIISLPTSAKIISALPLPKTLSTPTLGATAVAPLVIEEEEIVENQQFISEYVPITEEVNPSEEEKNLDFLVKIPDNEVVGAEESKESKPRAVRVIKESEVGPNYLDELIAVCEQNRSLSSDAANASQRLIAATVDLFIIATASSIFWGTSYVLGINLSNEQVVIMLSSASVFVGLIYLTMMVFVTARTFGMMFVGTRVINTNTKESPSMMQAFLRAIGYFISVGLLGLGFAWMFLDHERRTLHDVVSGTFVVRDY